MKYLALIGILLLTNCGSKKEDTVSILGKWKFQQTQDLRTKEDKSEYVEVVYNHKIDNRKPDKVIMNDGKYIEEYDGGELRYGLWEIKNDTLFLSTEAEFENEEILKNNSVLRAHIRFKEGSCYYIWAGDFPIKSLSSTGLQLGDEKLFDTYKRVE